MLFTSHSVRESYQTFAKKCFQMPLACLQTCKLFKLLIAHPAIWFVIFQSCASNLLKQIVRQQTVYQKLTYVDVLRSFAGELVHFLAYKSPFVLCLVAEASIRSCRCYLTSALYQTAFLYINICHFRWRRVIF